ncbi:hypothetical protein DOTSEDRAFT_29167 [Dothistroma septosporum NZE10]|uniref:Uncharacterized protein n=1 Tax=Dothistroma septosporum (strain NZE10 / CBS 128990) TaxID=675120 RepID=M2Y0Z7_DOTSN|nr:hypothetical protein DOTSEDRAFT_29167 [Dothistroma septosporum NZE10]
MRLVLIFTNLLTLTPTVFGAAVNTSTNSTSEDIIFEPTYHLMQKEEGPGTNHGGMQGGNSGWQVWAIFPYKGRDKFYMLRYSEPNCKGKIVHKTGYNMQANSDKHFKTDAVSMRYALPTDLHMSFVDITFWDQYVKGKHGHRCGGNVVYKLNGGRSETIDGDRYACHPIPGAVCVTVGPTHWKKVHH